MEQPFIELDRFMRILIVKVSGQILNTRIPIKLVRSYDIFFIKLHRPLAAVSNERHEDIRQFRVIASFTRKLQQIEGAIGIAVHNHLRATNRRAKLVPLLNRALVQLQGPRRVLVAQQIG